MIGKIIAFVERIMDAADEREKIKAERAQLEARRDEMIATLDGCDWCCGGGDRELEEIEARLAEIAAAEAKS